MVNITTSTQLCACASSTVGGQDSARNKAVKLYFTNIPLALILCAVCTPHAICSICNCRAHFLVVARLHIRYQICELIGEICVHGGGISISHLIVSFFLLLLLLLHAVHFVRSFYWLYQKS